MTTTTALARRRRIPRTAHRGPHLLLPPLPEHRAVARVHDILLAHPTARSVVAPPHGGPWPVAAPTPPARGPLPDPDPLCGAIVLAAIEALNGTRPLIQLTRWVSPAVMDTLAERIPAEVTERRKPATVRSTHLMRVSAVAAEASVVVHDGDRVRAAAMRLEVHRRHWRATVLQIG
jgi:hypothetical protein